MSPFIPGRAHGRILTAYGAFTLQGDPDSFSGVQWTAGFVTARDGGLWFRCGGDNVYVAVEVNVGTDEPDLAPLEEWDQAVEFGMTFEVAPVLLVPLSPEGYETDVALQDIAFEQGPAFLRAYTRGGAELNKRVVALGSEQVRTRQSADPAAITEQVRIDVWPAPSDEAVRQTEPHVLTGD